METIAIQASKREVNRSKGAREVRRNGLIPSVLYAKDGVEHIAVDFNDLRYLVYTPDFKVAEMDIEGEKVKCILKDIQFHPVTEEIVHADFLKLIPGHKVRVEIPVHFEGTPPGLRSGGKLIRKIRKISIRTIPEYLMDEMVLDISHLNLGDSVRVRDIDVEDEVEILDPPNQPVASIEIPRLLKTAAEIEAEEAEALEAEEGEEAVEGEGGEEASEEGGAEGGSDESAG